MKHLKLTAAISALLLSSCTMLGPRNAQAFVWPAAWSTAQPGEAKYGGMLNAYGFTSFSSYNPFTNTDNPGPFMYLETGANLFMPDPRDNQPVPHMAAAQPIISEDGKVYTIKLRKGLKFSDGTEITARDFVTTWKLHADKELKSPLRSRFFMGEQPVTFEALDPYTLRVTFPSPPATALNTLAFAPWPDHIFGAAYQKGGAKAVAELWGPQAKAGEVVSAGMLTLGQADNRPEGTVTFVKNRYWGEWNKDSQGRSLPYLDGLSVYMLKASQPTLPRFLAGQADLAGFTSAADARTINDAVKAGTLKANVLNNVGKLNVGTYLVFNWNKADDPFKQALYRDVRFRRAVSHLINRQKIVEEILGGMGEPTGSIIPAQHTAYIPADLPTYGYDPAAAAKLLADLGFTQKDAEGYLVKDGNRAEFEILSYASDYTKKHMDIIIEDARAAGVKVTYRPIDGRELFKVLDATPDTLEKRPFDAAFYNASGPPSLWPFTASSARCDGVDHQFNRTGKCLTDEETKIAALAMEGEREPDLQKRTVIGQQLHRLLAEQQYFIPIVAYTFGVAYNERIGGVLPPQYLTAPTRSTLYPLTFIR